MIAYKIQSTNMRIELSFQGFSNFRDPHKIKTLNSGFEIPPKSSLCVHLPVLLIGSGKPSHSVQCAVRTPQSYRHSAESAPTPSMHLLIVAACHLRAPVSTRPHHKCCMAQKPTSTNCFCDTVLFYLLLSQHPKAACRTGRSYSL